MIQITPTLHIEPGELKFSFIRAGGPGGQNVNKVATAAQLRFDVRHSPSLPTAVKSRLEKLAGSRLTLDGVIVITASAYRTQEANRKDAIDRLVALVAKAAEKPTFRVPSLGVKKRRLESKSKRGQVKRLRSGKPDMD